MRALVTGGAGFIGRWVVKRLLEAGHDAMALDNLANGRVENVAEFHGRGDFLGLERADIRDYHRLRSFFRGNRFDVCYHLAASINVQDSIDDPRGTFENDVVGTFNVLECCRALGCKIVYMGTCMVYGHAEGGGAASGIAEGHPTVAASPYAGSKLAGESLALSYGKAYGLPVAVVRPFNTYGPYQKSGGEGGVVSIFIQKALAGEPISIYGDGTQTRDLLFVEDCAEFVVQAGLSDAANGEVLNAGTGRDVDINTLARMVVDCVAEARAKSGEGGGASGGSEIRHVPHIHPQAEIARLLCDPRKAKRVLGWAPRTTLEEGIERTRAFLAAHPNMA